MMPEVSRRAWRKGGQWFAITRQHALLVVADSFYYRKFSSFCKVIEEQLSYVCCAEVYGIVQTIELLL
jgi:hypothetical protein